MRKHNWIIAAMMLICAVPAFAKVDLDLSEPKAAARTFVKAIAQGDLETAKAAAIANEKQQKWIESLSNVMGAYQALDKAMTDKFGKPTPEQADMDLFSGMREENILKELDTMRVEIKGDTARLLPPKEEGQPEPADDLDQNMVLKKVDGKWKVDVTSISDADMSDLDQSKSFATLLRKLAGEVNDGKYKSRDEVTQALMMGAMTQERPATTQSAPTAQPDEADGAMR